MTPLRIVLLLALSMLASCATAAHTVRDSTGALCSPLGPDATDVVVLVFGSPDCPIANAIAPELERLHQRTIASGGTLYLVHAQADVTPHVATRHAHDYGLTMPVLLDKDHALVNAMDATVTPEGVVLARTATGWRTVYQGRVNDLYASIGNRRDTATEHWLRAGIDAAFADSTVTPTYRRPVGCFIEQLQ